MCHALRSYHQYFALISQVLVAVMLILRTFALYERNKAVLAFMIFVTLGAFAFALGILFTRNDDRSVSPRLAAFGCPVATTHSKGLRLAVAWSGMLVFDVMIFGLTLIKALRLSACRSGRLLTILIRDGSMYFALLIISNACNIATYTMGGPFTRGSATTVTNITSSIMISRLIFNLRVPARPRSRSGTRTRATGVPGAAEDWSADAYEPELTTVAPHYSYAETLWTRSGE
ncbi:hypothetical protein GGX14DRAFT_84789 [Mycena pura]|uniref:Uncharacterized protein n=1 Tax=Mycena pura TaxID=153505 RepID=A0AAD6VGQ1_9AGAR|nr:hypothetical protein GGX14DRAFT_84789 [Mycena pura]